MTLRNSVVRGARVVSFLRLQRKYHDFTMAPAHVTLRNLLVADRRRHIRGCVVECGVWRGGMSAAIAEALGPERDYLLFDSFEGLPPATDKDGLSAQQWQEDKTSPAYYDNCCAPIEFAETAMKMAGAPRHRLVKGWFEDTIPGFELPAPIAILRLDGDWYTSTYIVLEAFFHKLAPGGIAIVDDYFAWDGCSRAVHDFLSKTNSNARIKTEYGICMIEPRI